MPPVPWAAIRLSCDRRRLQGRRGMYSPFLKTTTAIVTGLLATIVATSVVPLSGSDPAAPDDGGNNSGQYYDTAELPTNGNS
jgi:hypothetical protein